MGNLDDAKLRAMARETSEEMNDRIARHHDLEHIPLERRLDELEARQAVTEHILGVERDDLHDVAYDGFASGDDGVVWDDFEYDQSVNPKIAKGMVDRNGYGRR